MNKLGSLQDRRIAEYGDLVRNFIQEIKGIDIAGIEEPHLPVIGSKYESCKYKIAFCGWETKGWGPISKFIEKDPYSLVTYADYTINDLEYLDWPANYHATFFGFVLKFLSAFYEIPFKDLIEGKSPDVLRSFLWGNTNSIERFEVSAARQNASYDSWKIVKQASLAFDNLNHILNVAKPKIVFLLYSGAKQEYFLDSIDTTYGLDVRNRNDYLKIDNREMNYRYYFRRDTGTHIFCLPHPTYMGVYSGKSIDEYVKSLLVDISNYRVWDSLPSSDKNWFQDVEEEINLNSSEYKRVFVANLAKFLIDNNSLMSGKELQDMLRRNGIKTSHGYEYGANGGRGIHRLISNIWAYYYNKNDFQTAYNIARAFVNQNGEYPYDL